jgi:hypothetical protein
MAVNRRGGAFALALALTMSAGAGACSSRTGAPTPPHEPNLDAAVFQECDSVCLRPGDCAQAFNDDGICPPGFLCALRFSCSSD